MEKDEEKDSAQSPNPGTSSKRKKVYQLEPRTPLKRQRVPVEKFQSPAEEIPPKAKETKEEPTLLYKKGLFLAVRGDEGSFYLCKTNQNVFNNTKRFKIQWLDLEQAPDLYKIDFMDSTDIECVLTNVKMERVSRDTYRLPNKEQTRVENILNKAIRKERGEPVDEEDEDLEPSSASEEDTAVDWEDIEPVPSTSKAGLPKVKAAPRSRKAITVSLKSSSKKGKKGQNKKASEKVKKKTAKGKEKQKEKKKTSPAGKEQKAGPDKKLKPNPKIKVLEKEPFFETNEPVEFMSKNSYGKLAIRAVNLNDMKLLQNLTEDTERVHSLELKKSVSVNKTALHYALEANNHEAIKILVKDYINKDNERLKKSSKQSLFIKSGDTGSYNPMFLGFRRIRPISVSRGSKEGNDALTKDVIEDDMIFDYAEDAIKLKVKPDTLDVLINQFPDEEREALINSAISYIYQAVLTGNRKLAGKLVEEAEKRQNTGFGFLHKEVLMFDNEDLRQVIQSKSVCKKPYDNKSITPLHCAAINPNVKYLSRLLSVEPNINLEDRDHRRPLHFAAVCDGIGPLELLLQRGASTMEVDMQGMMPLHYACAAGRARNVDTLLKRAKEGSLETDLVSKWGPGGVNRPSRRSECPIHIAVTYGHADVLKILIKHQVDVNKPLSAGKNKLTPLMIAAQHGYLDIARILVQNGAVVEQRDKHKRTALIHAVMNGNTHIASYLLYLGSDPDKADSSGNTVLHYAAGYGWQFSLKLLLKAGADPTKANEWKTTPVSIAFLKGHIGLVDYLLSQPGVDIDFKNDEGKTLTSIATSSPLENGLYEQIRYLIEDKKADPTIKDASGLDALHYLAANKIQHTSEETMEKKMDMSVKIAELLLSAGCDPSDQTEDGRTPLMFAIEQVNIRLVEYLVEKGGTVSAWKNDSGKNVLHSLADQCMSMDLCKLVEILVEQQMVNGGDGVVQSSEEKMEVDADRRGGDFTESAVNERVKSSNKVRQNGIGLESDVAQKERSVKEMAINQEKAVVEKNAKEILVSLSRDVDDAGFTPLLRACKKYRGFKRQYGMKNVDVNRCSENGRNFIRALIELTGADFMATVQEKKFTSKDPALERNKYSTKGKCSAVLLMTYVLHETELKNSIESKHLMNQGLNLILEYSPFLEDRNLDGETALIVAVQQHLEETVRLLVKSGADVNAQFTETVMEKTVTLTPLLIAAKNGDAEIVKYLIEGNASVHAVRSDTKETALHLAVGNRGNETNAMEMATALLQAGANVNAEDEKRRTPLHNAVKNNSGTSNASTDLEEFLLERRAICTAKDDEGRLPLHYAFKCGHLPEKSGLVDPIELCSVLVAAMGDRGMIDETDNEGQTPLHRAASCGATICCVHLLQRGASIKRKDKGGNTPFTLAVKNKHDSCAIVLLQKGACLTDDIVIPAPEKQDSKIFINKKPVWVWKPLRMEVKVKEQRYSLYQGAIEGELQGVAHMLLDAGELNGKVIEAALRANKFHLVLRHLKHIKNASLLQTYVNENKQNLLHILALFTSPGCEPGLQRKVAEILVERGVSLSQEDKYQNTPIMYAALQHQPYLLGKFFIESSKNNDFTKKDVLGRTVSGAFFWNYEKIHAHLHESTDWIKLLTSAGASLNVTFPYPQQSTPVFDIVCKYDLSDYHNPSLKGAPAITPLIFAMQQGDFGLTKFLLKNGASPNQPDSQHLTPLMHAVKLNDLTLVKLLLNYDYEPEAEEDRIPSQFPHLVKKLSRQIFTIKPGDPTPVAVPVQEIEPIEEEEDKEKKQEDGEEDAVENDDAIETESEDLSDQDELDENSDHDTDVVEEDEDEGAEEEEKENEIALLRLGSKVSSLRKAATSIGAEKDHKPLGVPCKSSTSKFALAKKRDLQSRLFAKVEVRQEVLGYRDWRKIQSLFDFPVVEKTSPADLNAKDSQGWTVVHHIVCPLEYGTYDNDEMLFVLHNAGASINQKDHVGLSPLDHALIRGAVKLASLLQKLSGTPSDKQEKPTFASMEVSDGILSPLSSPNFQEDAEALLMRLDEESMEVEVKSEDFRPEVDSRCMFRNVGEVVYDRAMKMPFDVTLSKIDVSSGLWDTYNFYKMQIIHHKGKDIYILFTRWGRIGDKGQYQHTPYPKLPQAVLDFTKIFRSKTGNTWANIKKFENQPKKYRLMPRDDKPKKVHKVNFSLETSSLSKLSAEVQDVVKEMANVGMMEAALKKASVEEDLMPFGRLKREALIEARKILQQLGELIQTKVTLKRNFTTTNVEDYHKICEGIAKLSTEYYNLVPQHGYAYDRIEPISEPRLLKKQLSIIASLLDIQLANQILLGTQAKIQEMNPLDYIYRAIGCCIQPLREDDTESQYILKYIHSSSKQKETPTKVLGIFKLLRPGEEERLRKLALENHRLLWHGSGVANFMSILYKGLLVSPPEVPITGHAFGEGIYLSDSFVKSSMYCNNPNPKSEVNFALLCEVALGNIKEDVDANIEVDLVNTEYTSLKIRGREAPNQAWDVALPFGASMPLGCLEYNQPKKFEVSPIVPYTEYVVQNPEQICLRYLVQFV
ncbi:hypothetical protein CHS0354_032737 [Potamilus streckersoni]|uniref:Poly [ADP-ribose] polymerase n=1 Tax=Potamilus streckersoni TaxID=2493646 RepID=A0AAE0TJK5_9BIVA|nr:hypothetical protein CHS0354_032737 [Potamilus streckersoni]